jgi:rSAM/selenodomain-associated transferase 2
MDRRAGLGAQLAPCYRRPVKLSVVIPTLDEAERIEAAIRGAFDTPLDIAPEAIAPPAGVGFPEVDPAKVEVIVVDGGSTDATAQLAAAAGARVLSCERGRAHQLGIGLRASDGDVVVMLHADTRLPGGWRRVVQDALRDDSVVGGAFRLRFDERAPVYRFIEFGAWLRAGLWRMPYGDQALFARRSVLEAIGGIPEVPVMEDLDLVQRLKREGRLALLSVPAVTSARRYRAGGPLRTMLRHWLVAFAWGLGVDRQRIAQWARR